MCVCVCKFMTGFSCSFWKIYNQLSFSVNNRISTLLDNWCIIFRIGGAFSIQENTDVNDLCSTGLAKYVWMEPVCVSVGVYEVHPLGETGKSVSPVPFSGRWFLLIPLQTIAVHVSFCCYAQEQLWEMFRSGKKEARSILPTLSVHGSWNPPNIQLIKYVWIMYISHKLPLESWKFLQPQRASSEESWFSRSVFSDLSATFLQFKANSKAEHWFTVNNFSKWPLVGMVCFFSWLCCWSSEK